MKVTHKRNDTSTLGGTYTCNDGDMILYCDSSYAANWTIAGSQSMTTNLFDDAGNELMSFDVENEKIMIDGEDATMNYTAIAMACKKFLASQIKQQKG